MYLIISVQGCLPYLELEKDEEGTSMLFDTEREAESYAKDNCAWDYKIIEWNRGRKRLPSTQVSPRVRKKIRDRGTRASLLNGSLTFRLDNLFRCS